MRKLDLTNQVFTKLTALEVVGKNKYNTFLWKCQCECGNTKVVPTNYLTTGGTKSCGCYRLTKGRRMDLVGEKYNKLTVISYSHKTESNSMAFYNCVCDCGGETTVAHGALRSGKTKSCGCLMNITGELSSNYIHGKTHSKVHSVWSRMKDRCLNPDSKSYKDYGAKGITVDPLFINDFEAFYVEVGDAPEGRYSLDRINYKLGYVKGNLRWATDHQQARNKGKQADSTLSTTGIVFAEDTNSHGLKFTRVSAIWNDLNGKQHKKSFAVKKNGLLPAFKLAFLERELQIKLLNEAGAGYSSNHGQ